MTAEAEAADEERQNLCLEVLQLYGDPEVFGLCSSLSQERRRHFLSSFQDFLEDKYRDLFLLATSRLRGHPVLGKPDVKASKTPGFEPSIATIRRCRRGSPQSVLYPPGAFGITRPLQVLLGPAVGRTDPTVIQEMEVKHIPQFGKQAWGHDLFEKQKELASELWRSSAMGSSPHLTELVRRRPCGQRDSGQRIAPGKLARIQASEITPFFYPEEAAACSITLVTDPATSPTGQIMTIARDGEGALERVFLDNQLPAAGAFLNDVAQARFAKGNKLDIMEPILVVHRDGLRGIAVRPDEARRLVTLGIHPADARAMGNKAVASQQYWAAAEFYCAGLQHAEMDIIATLLSNRCQAAPLYLCQRRCKAAQTAVQEAGCSMLTASEEDMDDVNKQYAARLQEFQDARKEFAKLSAKNDAPSEAALAAVAPYFEAEEEHRGQLAEEQSQEELLRQTVTQAKTRYHGALRSLETLSNQAHLRRASSGVLEPVSRTATEERQERMMKRSPTCQTPERPPKVLRGDSRRRRTGHGPSLPLQKDLGDEELMESEHELPAS